MPTCTLVPTHTCLQSCTLLYGWWKNRQLCVFVVVSTCLCLLSCHTFWPTFTLWLLSHFVHFPPFILAPYYALGRVVGGGWLVCNIWYWVPTHAIMFIYTPAAACGLLPTSILAITCTYSCPCAHIYPCVHLQSLVFMWPFTSCLHTYTCFLTQNLWGRTLPAVIEFIRTSCTHRWWGCWYIWLHPLMLTHSCSCPYSLCLNHLVKLILRNFSSVR